MGEVNLQGYKCERCSHIWLPRQGTKKTIVCPSCKSPYWNIPRRKNIQRKGVNL